MDRENVAKRQSFRFKCLDSVTVIWILAYLRDAIDFEWIMDAARQLEENTNKYTAAEEK
jgi:hypothetical protein